MPKRYRSWPSLHRARFVPLVHPVNLHFRVPGKPIAKERVGRARIGSRLAHAYTPNSTRDFENYVTHMARQAMIVCEKEFGKDLFPLDEPLWLQLRVFVPKPKKPRFDLPAVRPDVDNYVKAIMDGLSKAKAYVDDARVCELTAGKRYSRDGFIGVEVILRRFPG